MENCNETPFFNPPATDSREKIFELTFDQLGSVAGGPGSAYLPLPGIKGES
jgi:hypothetical protein